MKYECSEERFLNDVSGHKMTISKNDGTFRHLTFSADGSSVYKFEIITWPGYLTIAGDCGTYTFRRIADMFGFFIMGKNDFNNKPDELLSINPGYWGEKLESVDRNGGVTKFSEELFEERVRDFFEDESEEMSQEEKDELWVEVEFELLGACTELEAYEKLSLFDNEIMDFSNFAEEGLCCDTYTFHYIWCLYAIVWGIKEYNKSKS